ncbi:FtsX-like permease family protein [Catellatospora sp. NPDC049609]|uniref:FtsX-like permease family protein n=1 Tax=Catellatospora sp. NPDC049609 TaxID=3155505 RepID=UPI00341B4F64
MIALASLRRRWPELVGTVVTLAVAVAVLTVCGLLFFSARPVVPDRYAAAPVVVRPVAPTDAEAFTEPRPWPVERADALVAGLARVDGVHAAIPVHRFYAQLMLDGRPAGAAQDATGWPAAALAGPATAVPASGRAPAAPGEVVVDRGLGLAPGAAVTLLTAAGPEPFTVVGTVDGPGLWVSDELARARAVGVPAIGLLTRDGTGVAAVAAGAAALVGEDGVVLAGDDRGLLEPVADARTRWIGMQVLSALSALGVFVSVFIVASTFAFATRRRHRELALLRLIGAVPRQVRRMIHGEVLVLGLAGGVLGVLAGLAAAAPFGGWLVRTGFEPATFTVTYPPLVPGAALLVGVLVAQAGAWAAARRAARISPLDALREAALDDKPMSRTRWLAGLAALAVAILSGVAATRTSGANLGTYALYVAMALVAAGSLLAPVLVPPAVRLLTAPFARGRGATVLLVRQHTRTAARRTASTAAPVLLSVAFAVVVGGMVQTTTAFYGLNRVTAVGAASVVVPDGTPGLSDAAVAAGGGHSALATTLYDGPEPLAAVGVGSAEHGLFTVASGDLAALSTQPPAKTGEASPTEAPVLAAAVTEAFAERVGWAVGDTHPVSGPDGRPHTLHVVAVLSGGPAPAGILLDRAAVRTMDPSALTPVVYSVRPADSAAVRGLGARWVTAAAYAREAGDEDDRLVWVFTVVLIGVSAGFGLLAVVNTTLMAAASRAGDLRVLRLSGATRRQVLGALAAETAAVVLVAGGVGLAVAVAALAALARGLTVQLGVGVPMVVPWDTLAATVGVCLVLAVAAALPPAARSAPGAPRAD